VVSETCQRSTLAHVITFNLPFSQIITNVRVNMYNVSVLRRGPKPMLQPLFTILHTTTTTSTSPPNNNDDCENNLAT